MSEEIKDTQQTQQPDTTHPEDNGASSGKTFTQDEVNRIVAERLARERVKAQPSEADQKATELEGKERELANREMMSEFKDTLADRGYPKELVDALKGENLSDLKTSLRLVDQAFYFRKDSEKEEGLHQGSPPEESADSIFRRAFGLKKKGN